jgi:hypothetical protein
MAVAGGIKADADEKAHLCGRWPSELVRASNVIEALEACRRMVPRPLNGPGRSHDSRPHRATLAMDP